MTTSPTLKKTLVSGTAALMISVTLTACSAGDDLTSLSTDSASATQGSTHTTSASPVTANPAESTQSPSPTVSASGASYDSEFNQATITALMTASSEHPNAVITNLDVSLTPADYDVDLVEGATINELTISEDGTAILERDSDDADGDDQTEASAATLTIFEAIDSALTAHPGEIDDIELESDDGRLLWEVDIRATAGGTVEVRIDATTGEIISS